mmetsp:Transcript_47694/g.91111  ORF Transcript_47694/g.91111 Transcript_47694/m.91111 type:complete len:371 (+) Transcript_47694:550-1662(+)
MDGTARISLSSLRFVVRTLRPSAAPCWLEVLAELVSSMGWSSGALSEGVDTAPPAPNGAADLVARGRDVRMGDSSSEAARRREEGVSSRGIGETNTLSMIPGEFIIIMLSDTRPLLGVGDWGMRSTAARDGRGGVSIASSSWRDARCFTRGAERVRGWSRSRVLGAGGSLSRPPEAGTRAALPVHAASGDRAVPGVTLPAVERLRSRYGPGDTTTRMFTIGPSECTGLSCSSGRERAGVRTLSILVVPKCCPRMYVPVRSWYPPAPSVGASFPGSRRAGRRCGDDMRAAMERVTGLQGVLGLEVLFGGSWNVPRPPGVAWGEGGDSLRRRSGEPRSAARTCSLSHSSTSRRWADIESPRRGCEKRTMDNR